MATLLEACMKEEQHSVICFLVSEGNKPIKIHHCMKLHYSKVCLHLQQVYTYDWGRKFKNWVPRVTDTTRPGQAHRVVTPQETAEAEHVIRENHCVKVAEVAAMLDVSHNSAHHIIHDVLQFNKVSTRWVPRKWVLNWSEDMWMPTRNFCNDTKQKGDSFMKYIVSGDESSVHY
jgi:hypothetical protein